MNDLNMPLDSLFDPWTIAAGLIFGIIGFWLFRIGRKNQNRPIIFIGIAMMVYPYFIEGRVLNWVIGIFLSCAAYYYWT